jgi:hypothetical protein
MIHTKILQSDITHGMNGFAQTQAQASCPEDQFVMQLLIVWGLHHEVMTIH